MNKNKLFGILKTLILVVSILIFNQCMQDEYEFNKLDTDIQINVGLLTPVAYGSLSFNDLVSEFDSTSSISSFSDGLLYLAFRDSLFSLVGNDMLNVPDQDFFEYFIDGNFPTFPGWTSVSFDLQDDFPFTFNNNEKLDSIILNEGNIVLNVQSEFKNTGLIQMTFPNIQLNGVPLEEIVNITDASGSFSTNTVIPINGYTIILEDSIGSDSVFLPVLFHVELYGGGTLSSEDSLKVVANITDLNFKSVFGYIGDYELISQQGDLDLGFFESAFDGYVVFEDPQINFYIDNSYGVPAAIDINRFTGFKSNGDSIQLSIDPATNPFRYAYPKLPDYFNDDMIKDTVLSINGSNSTFSDFLSFLPSNLQYNMSASSNPDGAGADYNFLTDESRIDVDFEFLLPFWFKADSFALEDTMDMDLSNISEDLDIIDKITVTLEVSNGLPLDIDFQIYFLDSLYNPVDTLFAENSRPVISSGIIGVDNTVIAPGVKTTSVTLLNSDIMNLETVRYAAMRAGLKTPTIDNVLTDVKIYNDYKVDFTMSVGVDIKANSNDF